jgi:hypothetical protein
MDKKTNEVIVNLRDEGLEMGAWAGACPKQGGLTALDQVHLPSRTYPENR